LLAVAESKLKNINLEIILVGDKIKIQEILDSNDANVFITQNHIAQSKEELLQHISIIETEEVITMHDDPLQAIKTKKNSSMVRGIELVKNSEADGYVSAGNTGAILTIATMVLGRIEGVSRPTIGVLFPTAKRKPMLIADVGATIDCRARFLYEYAVMGSIVMKSTFGLENPSVGLLNVGEENTKGTAEHIEANKQLSSSKHINFYGNVEGNDILLGKTDIVVTDGFTGNAILKFSEAFAAIIANAVNVFSVNTANENAEINPITATEFINGFNSETYGGVPLLGVKGTVIIGHGNSTPKAIKNMVFSAVSNIQNNVCGKIAVAFNK
jgi:glycerol-3-phosphate acyltransferase PlsX